MAKRRAVELAWLGLALAAVWMAFAVAAARLASRRGYPVIWISVLMGPLGWAAMHRLTRTPRPGPESRHQLLQWAALTCEGLPAGDLPEAVEPRLVRLAETARGRGRERVFARGLQDLVRFERLWDRMLPWLVLNVSLAAVGGGLLLLAAGGAFRSSAPGLGALLLLGVPLLWLLARLLLREQDPLGMETLLARGQALHLARLAVLAGEPAEGDPEGLAREVQDEVAHRLREARRSGRLLGALLAIVAVLLALLPRVLG